jgi:hypothetical protein
MPAGHKTYSLRGGTDNNDFPARDITLKDVHAVGRIAWQKWGHLIEHTPLRTVIGLTYAEGLYHGAMIALRDPELFAHMTGSGPSGILSVAAPASSSETTSTAMPTVKDLLESL